jgi:Protein of unknown function (DUF1194)
MVRLRRWLGSLVLGWALIVLPASAQEPIPVDLALVLAVDTSGSIDPGEYQLQMQGLAVAFQQPAILDAIRGGRLGAIAVTLVQWSGADEQIQAVAWTMISDEESMMVFASQVAAVPRRLRGSTSISGALAFSGRLFASSGFAGDRQVIDVSGDGSNNSGIPPEPVRDRLVRSGITINGLAILNDEPNLKEYYAASVIGGDGAFVMVAESYESFSNAILSKLIREIASAPSGRAIAADPSNGSR